MRSEREIREKIEEHMDKLRVIKHDPCVDAGEHGETLGIIDALLWVLKDNSGMPI